MSLFHLEAPGLHFWDIVLRVCLSPGKEVLVMEPINGSQVSSCFLYYFLFCLFTLFSVRAPKFYLPKPFHFQFLMLMLNSQIFLSFSVLFSSNSYFANKLFSLISLRIFSLYISISLNSLCVKWFFTCLTLLESIS